MSTDRHRQNLRAAAASITVATLLIALKGWAQIETGSLAIAASLLDSVLDLMIALANLAAIRYAARPADDDHSFGHTAAEDIAALAQVAIVSVSALAIAANAVARLLAPAPLQAEGLGLAAMLAALTLTGGLVWYQSRVARRTGSKIVAVDMAHYASDFLPMLAALASMAASKWLGVTVLDSALALAAAAWILRTGLKIGASAWHGLMDREAAPETVARIVAIANATPGLSGWHDLKTRTSGAKLFVQIHAEIDGDMTLRQAHAISATLRHAILALDGDVDVIVHQDPV